MDENILQAGSVLTEEEPRKFGGRPKGSKNKKGKNAVVIPYKPREWAKQLHDCTARWIVLVIHRRAGKTVAALNHLQRDALKIPFSKWAFIAPTYKQAKNVAWDLIKFYARAIPGVEFNEVELTVRYPNGSKLQLFGADNPDSLRGIGLHGVVFDEYSQQPGNIFTEIIRPALSDNQGYAIWIGTPKGRNEFWRMFKKASTHKDEDGSDFPNSYALKLTVDDTHVLPLEEIEDAKRTMSEDEFQQEYMCSFDAAVKGAYYAAELQRARFENRILKVPHDEMLPVFTVWDLGMDDATAIGFYQKVYNEIRMIDYYENSDVGLVHYIQHIKEKPYVYGAHFAPHDIDVRELSTGKSRLEVAEELGIDFEVLPKLPLTDGINLGRLVFNRLYVDEDKCSEWLDAISQYQKEWDDVKGMFREKPKHDWTSHAADVHRYMAMAEAEFNNSLNENERQAVEAKRNRRHSGE